MPTKGAAAYIIDRTNAKQLNRFAKLYEGGNVITVRKVVIVLLQVN
jgi:hypothetical protein